MFNEWLTEKLKSYGWKQAELARRAKISSATISNLINGYAKPTRNSCLAIAHAFNMPVAEVLYQAGLEQKPNNRTELTTILSLLNDYEIDIITYIAKKMLTR
jgi:transcriptional regulator with XRE-family HTH domain